MRRQSPPWMALWIAPLLLDTSHLTAEQFGCYLRLICYLWQAGGALPDDDRVLARLAGVSPFKWRRLKPIVMAFFTAIPKGRVTQRRALTELWLSQGFGKISASRKASTETGQEPEIPGLDAATRERARGQTTPLQTTKKNLGGRSRLGLAREAAARGELPPVSDELKELIRKMGLDRG